MESHGALAHVSFMAQTSAQRIADEPLGEPALNRGTVDLFMEATRLKFTDAEIAELKRLYEAKTPQKSS